MLSINVYMFKIETAMHGFLSVISFSLGYLGTIIQLLGNEFCPINSELSSDQMAVVGYGTSQWLTAGEE